jgi:hypothetical protein
MGVRYTIERDGDRVIHRASRRDADGRLLAENGAEVRFALGSGTRGVSFLIERDGFLFQSPISWFTQERRWDISPGYGEFTSRPDFERAIQPECLYCHANRFRPVAGTLNRYETPIFEGHAIGCERCHGPGELHVSGAGHSAGDGTDLTIVNPASLTTALRDSVCEQCHLQGSFRFARAGRDLFDYRPGLPIHRFLAVFLMKKGAGGSFEAVGHSEQMAASRCSIASDGQLGCISCHDPHRLPPADTKAAYYRDRCLACHEKKGCALPLSERQSRGQARGDDCIACHMPKPAITNVPHTAATDHRIPRGGKTPAPDDLPAKSVRTSQSPLADFHWNLMSDDERRDAARDMGVAQGWAARELKSVPPIAKIAATQGLPLLVQALRDQPDDLAAREILGHAFEILGRPDDALRAFAEVLRAEPGRELALRSTGRLLEGLQRYQAARSAYEKAIAVDPWRSNYRLALAGDNARVGDWPAAIAACREAIRLNPELMPARSLLVQCYLRSGEPARADAEFQTMLRFYPASIEPWQRWYEVQKQIGAGRISPGSTNEP